jgi:uncharacterized protein with von Willebrand factor type A (vWA) domain
MREPRQLSDKEKAHLFSVAIRNKDKPLLKRIRKGLVKDNEYRWFIKEGKK